LKVIFAGTPEFSVPTLQALLAAGHQVVAVYTQPDRPAGRGQKLTASPVKQAALAAQIPVYQPKTLRDEDAQQVLRKLAADVVVVVAYGLILPKEVLQIPRLGCINVHASLLPRWRGAAPIQRAILAGDQETGITIMQMDEGLDTGAMLSRVSCLINNDDASQMLHDRLAVLGGDALVQILKSLQQGVIKAEVQNEQLACYAKKIEKNEAEINWQQSAEQIDRMVRAFNPWPVAYTFCQGELLRVWQATFLDQAHDVAPGVIVKADKEGINVATGKGVLRLVKVQLPGGKCLPVGDIMNAKAELFAPFVSLGNPL
jgi:methionyl-tRNA formyltransferase